MDFLMLNKVLGTSGAGGGDYQTTTAGTNHDITLDQEGLPQGRRAKRNGAWYFPIDNLPDIPAFGGIDVNVTADDTVRLSLKQASNAREGLLRIKIVVAYE
jgi:hypothetical protein